MTTYHIPAENLATVQAAVAQLAKTARKLHLAEPTCTLLSEETADLLADGTVIRRFLVEVTGEAPVIAGWTFAGVVQFIQDEAGTVAPLFRTVPGESIPPALRALTQPWCDHCRLIRARKDTYLVHDAAGWWQQIGSSCLADFTGHPDPQAIARYAEALALLAETAAACEDPDFEGGGGGGGGRCWQVPYFLTACARTIREDGWVSGALARETGRSSTKERVVDLLTNRHSSPTTPPTAADQATATAALAWARGPLATQAELNDYEYNLRVATSADICEPRLLGLVASLIPAWQRAEAQRIEQALAQVTSTWQGEIGQKLTTTATVLLHATSDGQWGTTHIIKLQDAAGNHYVWFASALPAGWQPQAGDVATLTGKVKEHGEYHGAKETILTRCKVQWDATQTRLDLPA